MSVALFHFSLSQRLVSFRTGLCATTTTITPTNARAIRAQAPALPDLGGYGNGERMSVCHMRDSASPKDPAWPDCQSWAGGH